MTTQTITIDSEFKSRLFPQADAEAKLLEESLAQDGCRDSLVVWNTSDGECILIDGHHRYEICERLGIPYSIEEREFEDREAAKDWMDRNQAGRRNCSPEDFKILCGWIYNRKKKIQGGNHGNQHTAAKGQVGPLPDATAEQIAAELDVSPRTVKRNGQRAEVYDAMLEVGDAEAAQAAKKLPQADIAKLATAVRDEKPEVTSGSEDSSDADERRKARLEVAAAEIKAAKATHVSQNTGVPEWYTPPEFLESARLVMGGIDTDPASSEIAQRNVRAETFFTIDDNGLSRKWNGRVWMNPPYTSGLIDKFIDKLCAHTADGDVTEAIVLVNNATDTRWFQQAASSASAVCFPKGRIRFIDPEGNLGAPLQGQAIIYIGANDEEFSSEFAKYGFIGVCK